MIDLVTTISDERLAEMLAEVEIEFDNALSDAEADQNPQLAVDPVGEFDLIELRSILSELQSLRAQGGARVKPLEWSLNTATTQAAESLVGWYHVERRWDLISDPVWYWYRSGERPLLCSSEVEAKAAAQADYERRILSSLEASPAPVSEEMVECVMSWVRDDVLPAYNITHNSRASDPEMIEGCRAALAAKGGQ